MRGLVQRVREASVTVGGRAVSTIGRGLLVLIGVQLLATGVLGELLIRIYHEPEGRPQYVLRTAPRARKGALAERAKHTASD